MANVSTGKYVQERDKKGVPYMLVTHQSGGADNRARWSFIRCQLASEVFLDV